MAACQKINISEKTLQNYEAGVRIPPLDVVEKMADIYGCPIETFLTKNHKERE